MSKVRYFFSLGESGFHADRNGIGRVLEIEFALQQIHEDRHDVIPVHIECPIEVRAMLDRAVLQSVGNKGWRAFHYNANGTGSFGFIVAAYRDFRTGIALTFSIDPAPAAFGFTVHCDNQIISPKAQELEPEATIPDFTQRPKRMILV